jgi:hypothetical protein
MPDFSFVLFGEILTDSSDIAFGDIDCRRDSRKQDFSLLRCQARF